MPIDQRRRDEIAAAVAAYDSANPEARLPRSTVPLLAAMFPSEDVCQRSLQDIAAEGFDRKRLAANLRRLVEAGFLSKGKRDFRCMLGESLRVDRNGAIRRAPIVAKRSCFRGQQVFWFGARSAKLNGIRSSISSSVGRRGNSARTWRSQS